MINLFVVDDEIMAIHYFKSLVEKCNSDFQMVGSATNGEVALERIKELKPDVIFVDINMPIMNGLEISLKILSDNPRQKIVFLTSYRDFDYLKQGMDLGIETYLLKNELTIEALQQIMIRIAKEMEEEQQKYFLYAEHSLRQFLLGREKKFDFKLDVNKSDYLELFYVTRKRSFSIIKQSMALREIEIDEFKNQQKKNNIPCVNFIRMNDYSWCGIYAFHEKDREANKERVIQYMHYFFSNMKIPIVIVLGERVTDTSLLPFQFEVAQRIEKQKLFYGEESNISINDIGIINLNSNFVKLEIELNEAIENGNKNMERRIVKEYLFRIKELHNDESYEENIRIIFRSYCRFLQMKNLEKCIDDKWMYETFDSVEKIEEWLTNCIIDFHKILVQNKITGYSRITMQVLGDINKNYEKNISAQTIADNMKISEGHIRRVFKEEMNVTIADYLTTYRISKAKEFMKKGNTKVTELYQKVGFTSSQYFSSVFKKNVGISPSDYNRKCREDNEKSNF